MRDPLARMIMSGAAPGEKLKRLGNFLEDLKAQGFIVFVASHCDGTVLIDQMHKDHVAEIRRQAQIEERFNNG